MSSQQLPLLEVPVTALAQAQRYPRLRYMGSKYRLLPTLAKVFEEVGGSTALDPFAGSGVVSYLLKAQGFEVTSRDYLNFPVTLTKAACVNQRQRLSKDEVRSIAEGGNLDGRDFISRTYRGRFFTPEDQLFLDSAWSRIDRLQGEKRDLAIAALVLAAARKQPRGVFTVTGLRYDDGRDSLHKPLNEHFVGCVQAWNDAVFEGQRCQSFRGEAVEATPSTDLVYLDPPYAPPNDDNDYLKRYWFLEGLSDYWEHGTASVMHDTLTRKLPKRPTAFGSKRTIEAALAALFERFSGSTIVLSYGSNAVPSVDTLMAMLRDVKGSAPEIIDLQHRYHFGTHRNAARREATEYVLIAP
ncbi:adenine-specific DNA-methyltransferase [Tessaracoccus bendigoensis DSM 12906]|uniref:site-specific DNA-methyltransferase (adenine-specific) n=1 Tax=Tessaracoccus bendigoensis DSM 12906 TaxID=1123357 RepID=A0A1M6JY78_9ACTN|nr:DNA adenine methylase [Tessaracoccus bendigoensis]SHJ51591.1 adenine-specific DNA-methyltransferase [Tessaracoccus bendigoensis DSM 12906]